MRAPKSLQRLAAQKAEEMRDGMHPLFAVVFGLNYMMGSGFLTLPRAFVECSVVVGCFLTVFIAFGATVSAECLLDVMARAKMRALQANLPPDAGSFYRVDVFQAQEEGNRHRDGKVEPPPKQRYAQVSDLVTLYMGNAGGYAYLAMLVGFMVGSLWCYAAIFATSLEAHGGRLFGDSTYKCYVLFFGLMTVPLACRDLAEQKRLQTALALGRALMLLSMTITAGVALLQDGPIAPPLLSEQQQTWRAAVSAAPIVAFSCTLHHSVPQICSPVVPTDDRNFRYVTLNWIFRAAFALSVLVYVIFASTIALYFGQDTRSSVNLDWAGAGGGGENSSLFARTCGIAISHYIVLYPAINVVSTYPLNAVTLGDALLAAYRGAAGTIDDISSHQPPSATQTKSFRVVAAVVPLVGAFLADDISNITRFTGVFGLCMCAAFPGVLALVAKRTTPGETVHASFLNSTAAAITLVVVGAFLAVTPILSAMLDAKRQRQFIRPLDDDYDR